MNAAAMPAGRLSAPPPSLGTVPRMTSPSITQPAIPRRRKLGELLVEAKVIDELQLKSALSEQKKWGGRLGRTLVEMGFLTEETMVKALSTQLGLPIADLERAVGNPEVTKLLRVDAAERYGIFPVGGDDKSLMIASSDPTNQEMLKELAFATGRKVAVQVASSTAIDRAIRRGYYGEAGPAKVELSGPAANSPLFGGGNELVLDLLDLPLVEVPREAELEAKVAELTKKVADLETALASQTRALRPLMELLIEKGLVGREEYLARFNKAR
jgi:type IV pilus assembly protein PilB